MRFDWLTLVWLVGRVAARRAAAAARGVIEFAGIMDVIGQQAQACTQKVTGGGLLDGGVRQRCDCSTLKKWPLKRPTPFQ